MAKESGEGMYERITALLKNESCRFTPSGPTIGEIAARSAGFRDLLRRQVVPADEPVCLCCEDRSLLLAALLASLAGAPPFIVPHAFNRQVLTEAREARPFRLILADTAVEPPEGTEVISWEACPIGPPSLPLVHPLDQPFLWLFTGGSTGRPRLWAKTPKNLFQEAFHLAETFAVGPDDLILSTVGPRHIYGLLGSVLLPFVSQAKILNRTYAFPREILAALHRHEATILLSVPPHYRAFRTAAPVRGTLRLALSSAAPLAPEDGAFFLEQTGLAIHELYGSTETGGMALRAYGADHGAWEPFTCLEWKIAEERLCVRSPFVSPDLPRDDEGFFMTADRCAAAGARRFQVLGRIDAVVKIAGKRVDLEEVRERIRRIPGVSDACLLTLPRADARQVEICALIAGAGPAREIRAAVRVLADPYGRPRRVRIVKALPLLPNGKIDRKKIEGLFAAPPPRPRAEESPAGVI